MSTSQVISRITPLNFSSHPLHLSFFLRYHALLSTSLNITSLWQTSKLNFVRPPPNTLFSSNRLHRSSSLHQKYSRLPTHSQSSLPLSLKTSQPATTRHYLISSTFTPLITKQS